MKSLSSFAHVDFWMFFSGDCLELEDDSYRSFFQHPLLALGLVILPPLPFFSGDFWPFWALLFGTGEHVLFGFLSKSKL